MATRQVMTVEGMSCDGCAQRISSALEVVDGIEEVSADHKSGTVTLTADPKVADADVVFQTIEKLGYEVVAG